MGHGPFADSMPPAAARVTDLFIKTGNSHNGTGPACDQGVVPCPVDGGRWSPSLVHQQLRTSRSKITEGP